MIKGNGGLIDCMTVEAVRKPPKYSLMVLAVGRGNRNGGTLDRVEADGGKGKLDKGSKIVVFESKFKAFPEICTNEK